MCTTIIVGKYASKTGRVIVGHNEDAGGRSLHQQFFCPGGKHAPGEVVSGEPGMAKVPQVPETLDVYWSNMLAPAPGSSFDQGFANEAGLVICSNAGGSAFDAESTDLTDGGVAFLLRRLMAERAKTAREAVEVARELLERYGYAGEARNYTVADRDEAWVINAVRGRRFVAKRVPDDCVMLVSNALAIRTVDRSDTANVVASADLVEYAVAQGRYTPAHPSSFDDFDFARAYQSDDNRRNPEKSIRLREGWFAITGKYFEDELHYPEAMPPKAPMAVEDVIAILRTTAPETYRTRGDGRADAFHVSAIDISRSHTRESWVMALGERPLFNTLWRVSSYPDTGVYVPWFVLAKGDAANPIPEGYAWTTLEEAHKVQFAMKPEYLDFDYARHYYLNAVLGELVNFNRGLMAGVWPSREALESRFRIEVEATLENLTRSAMSDADCRTALANFTREAQRRADQRTAELLALLDTLDVRASRTEVPLSDTGEIELSITAEAGFDALAVDPETLLWSFGFTTAKASVNEPAKPVAVRIQDERTLVASFRTSDLARFAPAGVLCDTYVRGFCAGRRFVGMVPIRFTA